MNIKNLAGATLDKIKRRAFDKLSVGILGGAFDPITNGHIKTAQFVLEQNICQQVWLTPCWGHYSKHMAPAIHRLEMCRLAAAQADPRIKTFDYEIRHQLDGRTLTFVRRLLAEKYEFDFSLIIGQDNANCFDEWYKHDELEKLIRFIVVPRKGYSPDGQTWYLKPPHIFLNQENRIPEVSSTLVRNALKNNQMRPDLIDFNVEAYIYVNDLYKV